MTSYGGFGALLNMYPLDEYLDKYPFKITPILSIIKNSTILSKIVWELILNFKRLLNFF